MLYFQIQMKNERSQWPNFSREVFKRLNTVLQNIKLRCFITIRSICYPIKIYSTQICLTNCCFIIKKAHKISQFNYFSAFFFKITHQQITR